MENLHNLVKVTNGQQLSTIIEAANDKVVILFFYTQKKTNECRRALPLFEKAAQMHPLSYFCIVDMDNFEVDSNNRYTNNVVSMPKYECYHRGVSIGVFTDNIENGVCLAEQYATKINNMRNMNPIQMRPVAEYPPVYTNPAMVMQQQPMMPPQQLPPNTLLMPTAQQLQQWFQIFQMMQQMGMLNMNAKPEAPDETTILPSGDKIIPLGNGKYGLIKK